MKRHIVAILNCLRSFLLAIVVKHLLELIVCQIGTEHSVHGPNKPRTLRNTRAATNPIAKALLLILLLMETTSAIWREDQRGDLSDHRQPNNTHLHTHTNITAGSEHPPRDINSRDKSTVKSSTPGTPVLKRVFTQKESQPFGCKLSFPLLSIVHPTLPQDMNAPDASADAGSHQDVQDGLAIASAAGSFDFEFGASEDVDVVCFSAWEPVLRNPGFYQKPLNEVYTTLFNFQYHTNQCLSCEHNTHTSLIPIHPNKHPQHVTLPPPTSPTTDTNLTSPPPTVPQPHSTPPRCPPSLLSALSAFLPRHSLQHTLPPPTYPPFLCTPCIPLLLSNHTWQALTAKGVVLKVAVTCSDHHVHFACDFPDAKAVLSVLQTLRFTLNPGPCSCFICSTVMRPHILILTQNLPEDVDNPQQAQGLKD